jgi:hypothetical protein
VDPRAGLDDAEKREFLTLPGLELRTLGHPAHSQSLYRPRYPGSLWIQCETVLQKENTVTRLRIRWRRDIKRIGKKGEDKNI